MDKNGNWDWFVLHLFFHKEILDKLACCHPPSQNLGTNGCMWKHTFNGHFTVKSTYDTVTRDDAAAVDSNLKLIWKSQLHPRI